MQKALKALEGKTIDETSFMQLDAKVRRGLSFALYRFRKLFPEHPDHSRPDYYQLFPTSPDPAITDYSRLLPTISVPTITD